MSNRRGGPSEPGDESGRQVLLGGVVALKRESN
jgi:hypothetical protein